ncbi:MAG TPA: acyl-CoA synthetase [Nocardioides sp.]|uniref:acyl-CoA synthetase n=1 Tax=Nocardioides sp. TaxID=35761 RepID=UPI002C8015EC|nr:acyl-CoA synthetase [Nocardioides sp.]HTW15045.1 acyl-CoA synthetase [Nocardioides sp.]
MALHIADLVEHAVDAVPDRTALVMGETRMTYAELEARANAFAHHLQATGVRTGDRVGLLARNVPEHVVAMLAVFKVRGTPINLNYRYVEAELDHVLGDAGVTALVHERQYSGALGDLVARHGIGSVTVIEDGSTEEPAHPVTTWADALAGRSEERDFGPRSADDVFIVYTGGTTGYPKGVMWRHEDVWRTLGGGIDFVTYEPIEEHDQSRAALTTDPFVAVQLGPIMHANGQWGMLLRLFGGNTLVMFPSFDPPQIWRAVEAERAHGISVIGDAMARPLIEEYERELAAGTPYDARSLRTVNSAAAIFSAEVKGRWLDAFPEVMLTDIIGASETGFTGNGRIDRDNLADKGSVVRIGPQTVVLDDDDRVMDPDSEIGAVGRMARRGSIPIGYLNDPEKTARTFVTVEGERYAVPGDWVQIEPGRRLTLLGRGSNCINTGGEKVYPEEVEVALKSHPAVFDALVLGLPDPRYGQQVAALLEPRPGVDLDVDDVQRHLRTRISGYKVPRTVRVVGSVPRHVTGKADYRSARELIDQPAGIAPSAAGGAR